MRSLKVNIEGKDAHLSYTLKGFAEINGRLGKVEGRLDTVENAMAETGPRVDDLHGWCRQLDQRVTDLEGD